MEGRCELCATVSVSLCHRKENSGKLSITTPEKLHYCFPTSIVLQALGILGNTILLTSVLLLFPLCTSTREGGHYTTATWVVHSCTDRSWTYLLYGSVLNSVGIVIVVNDIQIHHCLSWNWAAELHIQWCFSSSLGEHSEVCWFAVFHTWRKKCQF